MFKVLQKRNEGSGCVRTNTMLEVMREREEQACVPARGLRALCQGDV